MKYRTVVSTSKNAPVTDLGLFPDPLHCGSHLSLGIAVISDVLAALLLIGGVATRAAALFIACNIGVAWIFVHHALFFGPNADHGELCILYVCGCMSLVFTGAGRFSADDLLSRIAAFITLSLRVSRSLQVAKRRDD